MEETKKLVCPNDETELKYYDHIRYYDGMTDTSTYDDIYICPVCGYKKVI